MDADEVSLAEGIFERNILDPSLPSLQATLVTQVHQPLNHGQQLFVRSKRFIAQNIHVEADTLLDNRLPDSACADDRDCLASHFIAQEGQIRMPIAPLVLAD